MRRALTLKASLHFLGIAATYLGAILPNWAQDPQQLFGADKANSASTLPKASSSAKKAPAAKPGAAPQGHSVAAAAAKPAAPLQARPAAASRAKAAATQSKPPAAHAKAETGRAVSLPVVPEAAPAARLPEAAKAEVKPLLKISPQPSARAAPKQRSATAGAPRAAGPRVSAPPLASRAQVGTFCNRLWNKIQNNWEFATGKNHVILGVDVDSSGNVIGIKVSSHPKNANAEARAQEALTKSQPLEALPAGLPSAHLTITFDSTADPHGDTSSNGRVDLQYIPGASIGAASPAAASPASPASPPADAVTPGAPAAPTPSQ
jgi:hypothetical protein